MKRLSAAALAVLFAGVAASALAAAAAAAHVEGKRLSDHVRILASDEFEGRGPATAGEKKAIDYISRQFAAEGVKPGGPNGSWFQDVVLNRFSVGEVKAGFSGALNKQLVQGEDFVASTRRPADRVSIENAPLVFVGYGVNAPERGWDDYKGVDLHGKVAVVLVNDPDFQTDLHGLFGGKAMTYYGRWTYKYEELARQGAAGILIVHETEPASYGWNTVKNSWSVPQFDIVRADPDKERAPLEGWIQLPVAEQLFKSAGLDFATAKKQAQSKDFKPIPLTGVKFSADFAVKTDKIVSHNVIGRLPGTKHPEQTIVYGAHWDHLGVGAPDPKYPKADRIFNGAVDNATGVAGLLELGRVFAAAPRTDRSIVFIAYTGEEKGLLGSEYYAANPVYPLAKTVAAFNMDGLPVNGPAKNLEVVGYGQDTLEDDLKTAAAAQHRTVEKEASPEAGHFYRSDHFSFAKRGVPVLYAGSGEDMVKGGRAAGKKFSDDYTAKRYHQPGDEWSPNWNWSGAVQDVDLLYGIGRKLADSNRWPEWKVGSEFKAVRDATADQRK